jgi:hypothetical protein
MQHDIREGGGGGERERRGKGKSARRRDMRNDMRNECSTACRHCRTSTALTYYVKQNPTPRIDSEAIPPLRVTLAPIVHPEVMPPFDLMTAKESEDLDAEDRESEYK